MIQNNDFKSILIMIFYLLELDTYLSKYNIKKMKHVGNFDQNSKRVFIILIFDKYINIYVLYVSIHSSVNLAIHFFINLFYTSIHLPIYIYLTINITTIPLSVYPFIYLTIYPFSHLSIYPFIHMTIYPSIHLTIYPSFHLTIYLSNYLSI